MIREGGASAKNGLRFPLPRLVGDRATGVCRSEEKQSQSASTETRALTEDLMERICAPSNLNRAYKRVKRNKGAAGVDGVTLAELPEYLKVHKEELLQQLLEGSYEPQAIRGVEIPKPDGSKRQLGIPTVIDRVIQQAILQELEPLFDPGFSDYSYGFREGRSAHQALNKASEYVKEGYEWVVDIDLEKFFDKVNHDILMERLSRKIGDKRVLKLIRRYLQSGMMQNGVVTERQAGTPQGSPLSPLLSNIMLDDLDKELERRGHKYVRYADDGNIYVRSQKAGERVLKSIRCFLSERLRLKLNEAKSGCEQVDKRKFLGYRLLTDGRLTLAPITIERLKKKVRELTKRNRGCAIEFVVKDLNQYLRGWLGYFRLAENKSLMRDLDSWIRRRLRCYRLKQRKRSYPIARWLQSMGVNARNAWSLAKSSKGWWRLSRNPIINSALPNRWFRERGLYSLLEEFIRFNV
jgi:RNA-directed DNA polymerase